MCNFPRFTNWVLAAQLAFLGTVAVLGVVLINSKTIFAGANIDVMILAIATTVAAAGFLGFALAELNGCRDQPCFNEFAELRDRIVKLLIAIGSVALLLTGITIVVSTPFVGAETVRNALLIANSVAELLVMGLEFEVTRAINSFNECQQKFMETHNPGSTKAIEIVTLITAGAVIVEMLGTLNSGVVPPFEEW